ncbi:hydrogenase nickel incorporation protein HypA/HybF [Clostridium tetanomorphum]|nr:hydrogenase maturation nickel metallochaperone HypA [Clostridium tetanomorphum]KAJ53362.1 hydrogenase nickel incorporation protein HypA [Clostridium tetanomorphum DSM 665]NRS85060.1 hydrogenase nickel incorporation protein HypA/HybF [Clostridium tetanomorphum]NRZ98277.1 hydrogenase nickel incorporation protein HypA/HybF [Clostridium tetanomorphum]SQB91410.1 hydrogenase nickel incorporation protein HypA [Clostridium tetanomorphum]
MHELSLTQSIVKICIEEGNKNNLKKIEEIRLKVGELSGIVPQCIQYYFDIISKDSILQGAEIKVERIPIEIQCRDCNNICVMEKINFCCPNCNSFNIKILKGNEFYIDSIKGE